MVELALRDLFRQLNREARRDGWQRVLMYRFVAGRGCIVPLSGTDLPAHAESARRMIEYDAVPLVALVDDTDRACYTHRLVYHAPSDTYYYGLVRTRHGAVNSTVWWYAVPSRMNDMLTEWLRRYHQTELPSRIELELTRYATAND